MSDIGLANLESALALAQQDAAARIQAAYVAAHEEALAQKYGADRNKEAAIAVAEIEAETRLALPAIEAQGHILEFQSINPLKYQTDQALALIEDGWRRYAADQQRIASLYEADTQKGIATDRNAAELAQLNARGGFDTSIAATEANAHLGAAQAQAGATISAAETSATASQNVAATGAQAQRDVATLDAGSRKDVATIQANAEVSVATTGAQAQRDVATIGANSASTVATINSTAQQAVATIDAAARNYGADRSKDSAFHAADQEYAARTTVATTEAGAQTYAADRQYAAAQLHEQSETARLNLKLGFANDKFNAIFPLVTQAVGAADTFLTGGAGSGGGLGFRAQAADASGGRQPPVVRMSASGGDTGGDQVGFYGRVSAPPARSRFLPDAPGGVAGQGAHAPRSPLRMGPLDPPNGGGVGGGGSVTQLARVNAPYISARGVFTPAQLQQQVNAIYARNDARTQAAIRQLQGDLAGRGFGAASPLALALQAGLVGSQLRASFEAASQVRLQAAQANVDATFRGQQALSQQFHEQEQVLLDDDRNNITRQVGVLQAVATMIGGLL
jgi:hypothetical protein